MLSLLLGVGIGYLAFAEKGRELGKKIIGMGMEQGAKIIDEFKNVEKKEQQ